MAKAKYALIGEYYQSIPTMVFLTVKKNGNYFGEAIITLDQFNNEKHMKDLIRDMEEMQASGVEMALIDTSLEREGEYE